MYQSHRFKKENVFPGYQRGKGSGMKYTYTYNGFHSVKFICPLHSFEGQCKGATKATLPISSWGYLVSKRGCISKVNSDIKNNCIGS